MMNAAALLYMTICKKRDERLLGIVRNARETLDHIRSHYPHQHSILASDVFGIPVLLWLR